MTNITNEEFESVIENKVKPLVEDAMHRHLGVTIAEIEKDIAKKLSQGPFIDIESYTSLSFKKAKKLFKKNYIKRLLQQSFGNVSETAKLSGLDRRSIHRIVQQLHLEPEKFRNSLEKSAYVRETDVKNIIENVLEHYKESINTRKLQTFYEKTPQLSKDIAKELPEKPLTFKEAEEKFEKEYLRKALEENSRNISKTARKIGLRFETLHRKLKRLGVI